MSHLKFSRREGSHGQLFITIYRAALRYSIPSSLIVLCGKPNVIKRLEHDMIEMSVRDEILVEEGLMNMEDVASSAIFGKFIYPNDRFSFPAE